MKKSRIIIFSILGIGVIAIAIGLMMYFKPHKDFAASTPDFTLTVADLLAAFTTDEAGATAKFVSDDKTVLVSGIVDEIDTDTQGNAVIVLAQPGTVGTVSCTLIPQESATSITLQIGQPVRIQGQCTGMTALIDPQVIMIRCALVQE